MKQRSVQVLSIGAAIHLLKVFSHTVLTLSSSTFETHEDSIQQAVYTLHLLRECIVDAIEESSELPQFTDQQEKALCAQLIVERITNYDHASKAERMEIEAYEQKLQQIGIGLTYERQTNVIQVRLPHMDNLLWMEYHLKENSWHTIHAGELD